MKIVFQNESHFEWVFELKKNQTFNILQKNLCQKQIASHSILNKYHRMPKGHYGSILYTKGITKKKEIDNNLSAVFKK